MLSLNSFFKALYANHRVFFCSVRRRLSWHSSTWGNEFRPMIEDGVRCAETWLEGSSLPLWWALAQNRKHHRPGDPQEAFEAGSLLRLQQTLIMRREAATSKSTNFDA
ncbi:LasR-specific antiactivator QslA [Pseudomonas hormoni]